jgi:hypothetical protein
MRNTRVQQLKPRQSPSGRWSCVFQTVRVLDNREYPTGETQSAAIWLTEQSALLAGRRALEILAGTGQWPNLGGAWV